MVVKTAFKLFGRILRWQLFENFNSISFLYFDWELIGLLTRVFSQFRPNTLLRFQRNCFLKGFFEIHFVFYIFSNFQLKYLDFTHQIRTSLSTLLSNSLQEIFNYNFLQERLIFFFIFGLWPKVLLTFHDELYARLPKLLFALLDEDFSEWKSLLKKYSFSNLDQLFSKLFDKFWAKWLKLFSTGRGLCWAIFVQ